MKDPSKTGGAIHEGGRINVHRITATSTTPGRNKDQEAYGSEIPGIYHIMLIVEYICSKHNTQDGSITITCNGIDALKNPWTPTQNSPVYPNTLT